MKTARRHELQSNELAHRLTPAIEWLQSHAALVGAALVGTAVVVGAFFYFQNRSKSRATAAWNEYFTAEAAGDAQRLAAVADQNPESTAGQLAALYLADVDYRDGVRLMNTDRDTAVSRLNEAKNRYSQVRQAADEPHIRERALLGLARFYEAMGQVEDAKREYTAVRELPGGLFHDEAVRKLKYLDMPSTVAFFEWFRKQNPKPVPAATGSFQGRDELQAVPPTEEGFPSDPFVSPTATGTSTATATATGATATSTAATPTATPTATSAAPTATPSTTAK